MLKTSFLFIVLLPFGCLAQLTATPQNKNSYTDTINNINTFAINHPVEKVYLHLNKPHYTLGDTIWFKAYTVIGEQHRLSALSGVLYAELINQNDSVVKRLILPLISGMAPGDFSIPESFKPGWYHLRAYTNWMRNAGADYFYNQAVQIGGLQLSSSMAGQTENAKPDVQFFPEGGQLVNGLRSKIAVKSVSPNGLGEDITGAVVDSEGNEVATFATQHLGMGVFALTPQPAETYKAKITIANGQTFTTELPKAQSEGFTLSVNNKNTDSIFVKIAANDQLFKEKQHTKFYLVARAGGNIYYSSEATLENPVFTSKIDKKRFPSGIVQFTLFSEKWEPINERIAFIQNNDTLRLKLTSPDNLYGMGQKVKIELDAKNPDNLPVTGSFSVSVINESLARASETEESTILSNLLLTSDLKGYMEKPDYYFLNPNDETKADLDVLMQTQGYRRFDWKYVFNNYSKTAPYKPEHLLSLTGTLKTLSGKPVPNGKIKLLALKENVLKDTTSDTDGNFKFNNLYFTDTLKVVLRAQKANNSNNVTIAVSKPDFPPVVKEKDSARVTAGLSQQIIAAMQKEYADYESQKLSTVKNVTNLKEVDIKAKKINTAPNLSFSKNLNGAGNADQVIMGDKIEGCVTLSDCLQGRVFGVNFRNGIPYNTRARGHLRGSLQMSVIVDGLIMSGGHLNDLNTDDVYSIEVLRSGAYLAVYGSNTPGGALIITTKHGAGIIDVDNGPTDGLLTYLFNGFYLAREFYTPKYGPPETNSKTTDLRTTLYWSPNIITDKNGKASLEYFNSNVKGTYRLTIEGIDNDGNLGRQIFQYKVE